MAYTQSQRVCWLDSGLGRDALLLRSMQGHEEVSQPFELVLELFSEDGSITGAQLLGTPAAVRVELADASERFFHGIIVEFEQTGGDQRFTTYRARLRPWLWLLTRRADCRIFQNQSVPDIVKKVFQDAGLSDFSFRLQGAYKPRVYCVQYRETDFEFVSRLLEEEGIFFFFEHEQAKHQLVLIDRPSGVPDCPNQAEAHFTATNGMKHDRDEISSWAFRQELHPGRYASKDYNFEDPANPLLAQAPTLTSVGGNGKYEIFDYHPEEYGVVGDGTTIAQVRMQEREISGIRIHGRSDCRAFVTGHRFTLKHHPRADFTDQRYLLLSARHVLVQPSPFDGDAVVSATYVNEFTCVPADEQYRPPQTTPRPRIRGPQTAVVVGPAGEEIYVDQYGRIKVQFHWDRQGKRDENSSCWIRVSQTWAGKKWGMLAHPRINDEVIVDFLEGDPDKPIVTGCVYNAQMMPPYDLPSNKTQSGLKSRSSKGGSPSNFNEIRFEDLKGSEEVYIQAEKNKTVLVKNDRTENVGNDETITIGHDRTETVGNNETITIGVDRTETVGSNETITIGANRTENVGSNETITIGSSRTEQVGKNETVTIALLRTHSVGINDMLNVGAAQEVTVGGAQAMTVGLARLTNVGLNDSLTVGKNLTIDAGDQITIKTGEASITMKKDGTISIKGKDISIKGSGNISVKADSDVTIKGSKIAQN